MGKKGRRRRQRKVEGQERAEPRAARWPWSAGRLLFFLGVVALSAAALRFGFARNSPDQDACYSLFYLDSASYYQAYAEHLRAGTLFNEGLSFYPPLPAFLLSLTYRFAGDGPAKAKFLYIIMGSAVCALVFLLGRSAFSERIGLWAGILCSASFGGLVLSTGVNGETPFQVLLLLTLLIGWKIEQSPRPAVNCICMGVLCGLMALTRAEGLWIVAPFALFTLLKAGRQVKARLVCVAVVLFAFALTVLPWTVRCHRLVEFFSESGTGEKIGWAPRTGPVTVTGPLHFALANNVLAQGGYAYERVGGRITAATAFLDDYKVRLLTLHGYREGLFYVKSHPLGFLRLARKKLVRVTQGFCMGLLASNFPGRAEGVRPPGDFFVPDQTWAAWPVLFLLVTGLGLSMRGPRRPVLLYLLFAFYVIWIGVFAGEASTGVMLLPFVYLLCLQAVARAASFLRSRSVRRAGDFLLVLLFASLTIGMFLDETKEKVYRIEGEKDPGSGRILPFKPVRISRENR